MIDLKQEKKTIDFNAQESVDALIEEGVSIDPFEPANPDNVKIFNGLNEVKQNKITERYNQMKNENLKKLHRNVKKGDAQQQGRYLGGKSRRRRRKTKKKKTRKVKRKAKKTKNRRRKGKRKSKTRKH